MRRTIQVAEENKEKLLRELDQFRKDIEELNEKIREAQTQNDDLKKREAENDAVLAKLKQERDDLQAKKEDAEQQVQILLAQV